jgi:hypothetical protein
MPKFRRVVHRLVHRTVRSHRLVDDLEKWERLATPEERARFLSRADVRKAA